MVSATIVVHSEMVVKPGIQIQIELSLVYVRLTTMIAIRPPTSPTTVKGGFCFGSWAERKDFSFETIKQCEKKPRHVNYTSVS